MKTNNLLTYLLYALLGLLILAAGYKACQMQENKKRLAAEEAELQKTLRDMGYAQDDTTSLGSTYGGDTTATTSTVTSSGIVKDPVTTQTGTSRTTGAVPATATKPVTTSKSVTTSTNPVTVTKPTNTTTAKGAAAIRGAGSGRWAVRAGTFSQMDGARRRLEEVIRLGYTNAEISKTSSGQAAVVVYRSNDKNAAIRVVDNLEEKGVDAAVFDRNKKD